MKKIPHLLLILDGVGERQDPKDNAVAQAHTPHLDALKHTRPFGLIETSGVDVGLPAGQFGNSEVGHMNLGAGRIALQSSERIFKDVHEHTLGDNPVVKGLFDAHQTGVLHLFGLLGTGGVHAHQDHMEAVIEQALSAGVRQVNVHLFLDGRDTPPKSARAFAHRLMAFLDEVNARYAGHADAVSVIGRFFAMDRDNRWERIQKAYDLMTQGIAEHEASDIIGAIEIAYAQGQTDEFAPPIYLKSASHLPNGGCVADGDGVFFLNFRKDRARQLTEAFLFDKFEGFMRRVHPDIACLVTMTEYSTDINAHPKTQIAYPSIYLPNTLGEWLQKHNKTQYRSAETEKYPHVTVFFNGDAPEAFVGETRVLIPSPKGLKGYDEKPEMSLFEVTDALLEALDSGQYDVLIVNFANGDMVGHSGNLKAAIQAMEAVDVCVGKLVAKIEALGAEMFITADHGNCEQMQDYESQQMHTQHTTHLVPFIYVGTQKGRQVRPGGRLCDVAPTLLDVMGLPVPPEMTGQSLLVLDA